jgi:hypothetical protein
MKKAVERLRAHDQKRTFHSGMFQSGLMLGLALPALIGGIYDSSHHAFATQPAEILRLLFSRLSTRNPSGYTHVGWLDACSRYLLCTGLLFPDCRIELVGLVTITDQPCVHLRSALLASAW